jgi:hypothetical protein
VCGTHKREGEVIGRRDHHRGEAGRAATDTLPSETYYKSLISLSEGTSERRDFKRGEEDYH